MIVLGIVGSPAGGKSTAAKYLETLGAEWINADLIARRCLDQPDVVRLLVSRFGPSILGPDGGIDRASIADRVFGVDSEKQKNLRFLESVVHPKTRVEILHRIEQAAGGEKSAALLDVPLLFESGWDLGCDAVWCIDADRDIRLQRSRDRGWDTLELDRREANQLSIDTKSRLSNLVMRNDATLDALHEKLRRQWDDLVRMVPGGQAKPATQRSRHCTSDRIVNS